MKSVAKSIQMIAWFDTNGKVNPMKFKYEDEEESSSVVVIDRIINRQLEKLAGNMMWKFTCSSKIKGVESTYDIKYDLINGKWLLFK